MTQRNDATLDEDPGQREPRRRARRTGIELQTMALRVGPRVARLFCWSALFAAIAAALWAIVKLSDRLSNIEFMM